MSRSPFRGTVSSLSEFDVIRLMQRSISQSTLPSPHGIGDDAAILPPSPNHEWLISKDLFLEGIHFDPRMSSYRNIGYKAAAVNISDIAAMGGTPTALLLGLAIPPSTTTTNLQNLYKGLNDCCKKYHVQLIGGDTCASPPNIILSITIIGKVKSGLALRRDGAKIGDRIYVSGTLGDSGAGLRLLQKKRHPASGQLAQSVVRFLIKRHQQPMPRVDLGHILSKHRLATSSIDLSDGLSGDLHHLCQASKVGANIDAAKIPLSRQCSSYMKHCQDTFMDLSLHSGEDYELLFTVSPRKQSKLERLASHLSQKITCIGTIEQYAHKIHVIQTDGTRIPMSKKSYDHFNQ